MCKLVGISNSYVWIGFSRDNPQSIWTRVDDLLVSTNFIYDWYEGYPKNYLYMQMSCKKSCSQYGTVYDYKKSAYFICQYYKLV